MKILGYLVHLTLTESINHKQYKQQKHLQAGKPLHSDFSSVYIIFGNPSPVKLKQSLCIKVTF